jgi:hypothetical protein
MFKGVGRCVGAGRTGFEGLMFDVWGCALLEVNC